MNAPALKLHALRYAIATGDYIPVLRARPELRKATEQMLWACAAAEACLTTFPAHLRERLGLVVASGQGELETTKEFYKALSRENLARPFLFQNSLHHSTAGLLSLALKLPGPAATVSDAFFSSEAALDLAADLLLSKSCLSCLVVGVDTLVPELEPGVRPRFSEGFARGEGAAALLLSTEEGMIELGERSEFHFEMLGRRELPDRRFPDLPGYYEADGLARLIEGRQQAELFLRKPDGTASRFLLGDAR